MASEVKTNKISPATGTDVTLGDASDTFTIPSGSAITVASGGDINVLSGGEIDIASSATLDVNGTIDVTGATVTGISLKPAFSACVNDATVSFSDATETKVTLNREIFDSDGAFDPTTNYRFTVPAGEGGKYLINGGVKFIGTGTYSNGQCLVFKNGSDIANVTMSQAGNQDMTSLSMNGTWLLDLSAADYLELYVYLDVASGVIQYNGNATSQRTWMSGFKLLGI
jgi:hypothetical protein